MKILRFEALAALTVLLCGCNGLVIDPLQSDGQSSQGNTTSTQETPSAIAMRWSQWNPQPLQGSSSLFQPESIGQPQPDDLLLFFGSRPQACEAPIFQVDSEANAPTCAEQAYWQTVLLIPAALAQPGDVDLGNQSIYVYRSTWAANCSGGSASTPGVSGTLHITSLDTAAAAVELTLDLNQGFPDSNGTYTATFCP